MADEAEPLRYAIDASSETGMRIYAAGVTAQNHDDVVRAVQGVLMSADSNAADTRARDIADEILSQGAAETGEDRIAAAIISVTGQTHTAQRRFTSPDDLLTIPEAMAYTRLSRDTLHRAVEAGELRKFGSTRRVLFLRSDLLAWLETPKARVDRTPLESRSFTAEGVDLGW